MHALAAFNCVPTKRSTLLICNWTSKSVHSTTVVLHLGGALCDRKEMRQVTTVDSAVVVTISGHAPTIANQTRRRANASPARVASVTTASEPQLRGVRGGGELRGHPGDPQGKKTRPQPRRRCGRGRKAGSLPALGGGEDRHRLRPQPGGPKRTKERGAVS